MTINMRNGKGLIAKIKDILTHKKEIILKFEHEKHYTHLAEGLAMKLFIICVDFRQKPQSFQ